MSYFAAAFFALSYFVAYLYVGPIACVPYVYWFVFGGYVAPNGRDANVMPLNIAIFPLLIISIAGWYALKFSLNADLLRAWLDNLSDIAEIKSRFVSGIDFARAKEIAGAHACGRCYDLFGINLFAVAMLTILLFFYLTRVHAVRTQLSGRFSMFDTKTKDNLGTLIFVAILIVILFVLVLYINFDLSPDKIAKPLRFRQANRLMPLLAPITLVFSLLFLFMTIKKFNEVR